jgi:hypothetical protein
MRRSSPCHFPELTSNQRFAQRLLLNALPLITVYLILASEPFTRVTCAENHMVFRGLLGTNQADIWDSGPYRVGELGQGPLIGGGVGTTLGPRWSVGLLGESVLRSPSGEHLIFTAQSLSLWVERKAILKGPWSLSADLNVGVTRIARRGAGGWDPIVTTSYTRYGTLLQPGITLGWSPVGFTQIFTMVAYRWTPRTSIRGSFESGPIDYETIWVDLSGPVVFAGINLFTSLSGPFKRSPAEGNSE